MPLQQKPASVFFFSGSIALVSAFAFVFHAILHSPISPEPLFLPSSTLLTPPNNNILQSVVRIGEGSLLGPEDVTVGRDGMLYTATRDGWIKRMHRNGSWEDWRMVGGRTLLGVATSAAGGVLVCDTDKGLLRVGDDGVTLLTSKVEGSKISFADDVIEASDGSIYFSDASTKFGLDEWHLDVLEARPHGRLLKYDPSTNSTSVLLDGLAFANGVALSSAQDFLVVCETWRYRCMRYWLKGEKRGQAEVFIDNLPGGPDNINLAPDGSFWIALLQLHKRGFNLVHRWKLLRHVVATSPKLFDLFGDGTRTRAMVVNVAAGGERRITRAFDDSDGKVMRFVTSTLEFEGNLYLGSLETSFIGKLSLAAAAA